MAQRRMFDKSITNNDKFIELPATAQNLYFHLSMNADDDGFIDNWRSITRMIGSNNKDIEILLKNNYIIEFESGVIVIRHWNINNTIRKERHHDTKYLDDYKKLVLADNKEYILIDDNGQPIVVQMTPEISLDKNRLDENREEENSVDEVYIVSPEEIKCKDIIDYLNLKAGTNYRSTSMKTKTLINARIKEGFTVDDFKRAIDNKIYEWKGTEYEKYLRPETLFGNKFESYVNQIVKRKFTLKDIDLETDLNSWLNE